VMFKPEGAAGLWTELRRRTRAVRARIPAAGFRTGGPVGT